MREFRLLLEMSLFLSLGVWGVQCSGDVTTSDGGEGNLLDGVVGQDPADHRNDQAGNQDTSGGKDTAGSDNGPPICNEIAITGHSVPPNLLLVFDKSGSMRDPAGSGIFSRKIDDLKDAATNLVDNNIGKIRFGLLPFPSNSGDCSAGTVTVNISDTSADSVRTAVERLSPGGGTPTGESLTVADAYQGLKDSTRRNFVLLLTDGVPTCPNGSGKTPNDEDNQLALDAVKTLKTHGVETFVIGFGQDINGTNPDLLNQMAIEGGHPRSGDPKYYVANTASELKAVFAAIGGTVIGCDLVLSEVPEYPNYLWVFFDGVAVPRDWDQKRLEGFGYDAGRNAIVFYGTACEHLKSGQVANLQIKMGCKPPD